MDERAAEQAPSRVNRKHNAREPDKTPVFLSHPKPVNEQQQDFLHDLCTILTNRGLHPRTLGVTDYDIREPLAGVYGVLAQCYGLFVVAFARTQVDAGRVLREWKSWDPEHQAEPRKVDGMSFTSPWAHIETGIAFALGLPVIIVRESGVYGDGVLEPGVAGIYLGEFELTHAATDYLKQAASEKYIDAWTHQVYDVVRARTGPPRLYH